MSRTLATDRSRRGQGSLTSYISIRTDVTNAGGRWVESQVVADQGIVTSRHSGDLVAFVAEIVEEVEEGPQSVASDAAQARRFRPLPVTFC